MTDIEVSTLELLQQVIGPREARRLFSGRLTPLFTDVGSAGQAHTRLRAAYELVKRYIEEDLHRDCILTSPARAAEYARVLLAGQEREIFVGMFLDAQHRLIAAEHLAHGTINAASVYPREVVKRALHHNAAAIIFAHNHPSGIAEPSQADRALTTKLRDAIGLLDMRVLDHFVVGGTSVVSFAERGWL